MATDQEILQKAAIRAELDQQKADEKAKVEKEQAKARDKVNAQVQDIVRGNSLSRDIDARKPEDYSDHQAVTRNERQRQAEATTITLPTAADAEAALLATADAKPQVDPDALIGLRADDGNAAVNQDQGENDLNDPDDTHRDSEGHYDLSEGDVPAAQVGVAPQPAEDADLTDAAPDAQVPLEIVKPKTRK